MVRQFLKQDRAFTNKYYFRFAAILQPMVLKTRQIEK